MGVLPKAVEDQYRYLGKQKSMPIQLQSVGQFNLVLNRGDVDTVKKKERKKIQNTYIFI